MMGAVIHFESHCNEVQTSYFTELNRLTSSIACDACFTLGKARLQASRDHDLQANPSLERFNFFKVEPL